MQEETKQGREECINGLGTKEMQQHCAAAPPAGRMSILVAKPNPGQKTSFEEVAGGACAHWHPREGYGGGAMYRRSSRYMV